jgi:O-antigen ligase
MEAWTGALHEVWRRPIAGHGFGTEAAVFVDRYYRFVGGLTENSYIGLALQLGAVGLLALLALVIALARSGWTALRTTRREVAAASFGVLAAGLVAGVVQSYFYSVGNIAAAALWIPAFLLAGVGDA